MPSLQSRLFEPISALPLAFFRVLFGFLAAAELINNTFYRPRHEVIQSGYTFRYYGFEWVQPLPPYC